MRVLRRVFAEPLVHFLALGAVLFGAYALFGRAADSRQAIVVTQSQIDTMAAGFTRTWLRPPSPAELKGLVDDHIRQEVYAREARALGLDRDDVIIDRRLRQKLEFVTDDVAAQERPTDAQLRQYFIAHPDSFKTEPRTTFDQVFLSRERHRESLDRDAQTVLTRLTRAGATADASALGDPSMLEGHFERVRKGEIAGQFGEGFAGRVAAMNPGAWQGPIESAYGVHLVFVREQLPPEIPSFDAVKAAVALEWANTRRAAAKEAFYQRLLERYSITIEPPRSAEGGLRPDIELASEKSR